ncbi:MAG TPA: Glu-tRNA(Gln) amidotransferase subunit GatD [Candidatus Nanoarchaeia archaeon]|nr:Glu-tRNA(Gln) amidotransferase subunit GatD [Candidatus Nanoarchaeia archaeon]
MFKQGEIVEVSTSTQLFKGVFINEEKDFLIIKLKSGYNIGISKRNIKEQKSLGAGKAEHKEAKKGKEKPDSKLPLISLLHTGGTIASKVDYNTGAVIAQFTPEDIIELFPELKEIANLNSKLISNMFSENMRFSHYNLMAKAVEEEIKKGARGIIITHGTDTLHYTAAALSFMLENIGIPVVIVGSQRSSDRPSSDSAVNLISAAIFITNTKAEGVFVCMHESMNDDNCLIMEGVNARKMHTSRRDAFRPINKGLVAKVDYKEKKIEWLKDAKKSEGKPSLKPFNERIKVGMVKIHPNMFADELECFKHYDGLVIEGTGLGHIGMVEVDNHTKENAEIGKILKHLAEKMPVVMSSQTIYGRIDMNVYSTGREQINLGLIGNYADMTPETAFIKLAWLLSNYSKENKEEIKALFEKSLRGEISERSEKEQFLI